MTNGTIPPPSAVAGDTLQYPSAGVLLRIALPWMLSPPSYTDLPTYWTPRRDWALSATPKKEAMWANVIAIATTKFAAHSYTIRDSKNSQRKVSASQELFKRADGGQGWVLFAQKVMRDMLTTDNGCFVRIRRDDDEALTVRVKEQGIVFGDAADEERQYQRVRQRTKDFIAGAEQQGFADAQVVRSRPGSKITGLYHLDSLRCTRTGNLVYPVRYLPVNGTQQILRWDQVLMYADQPSPRAELFGVGECAADRAYPTISKLAAMEQLVFENLTGGGANKLALINGIQDQTLRGIIDAGHAENQAKGVVYWLGTLLGAIPGDAPLQLIEIRLKELLGSFVPKDERDNAYLIYAKACGLPQQDVQALSGQGLGTGTQTLVLDEAARGQGALPAFLKWWEQTVSDRILPATTELSFDDENDMRDQKMRAEVKKLRADTRAAQITSGEISPAIARQLAVDDEDIPQELVQDITAGAALSDDEKPQGEAQPGQSPPLLSLIQSEPTAPPKAQQPVMKAKDDDWIDAEMSAALDILREIASNERPG